MDGELTKVGFVWFIFVRFGVYFGCCVVYMHSQAVGSMYLLRLSVVS